MSPLDWTIVIAYILGMMVFSYWLGRKSKDNADYYVGGRSLSWWALGISTMATQTSAISFMSIPAFVALRPGGGLQWLQYELGVPLAMIVCMHVIIPTVREMELVSVYQFLETRFGKPARKLLSGVFLVSRSIGTGAGMYASAVVLSAMLDTSIASAIVLTGISTIVYDTIGGMTAVVYSDVVQMAVLLAGLLGSIFLAADDSGGMASAVSNFPSNRLRAIDLSSGLAEGTDGSFSFFAFLIGGVVLYTSYYGADQSQVQRALSSNSLDDAKFALFMNGILRFPLTLLYCTLGIALRHYYTTHPDFQTKVSIDRPDKLVPEFILSVVPTGFKGLLISAILSASLSSLDSALNALSATTMTDWIEPHPTFLKSMADGIGKIRARFLSIVGAPAATIGSRVQPGGVDREAMLPDDPIDADEEVADEKDWMKTKDGALAVLLVSKFTTVVWGVLVTSSAFFAGTLGATVIESINKVGSCFYGPVLAAFLLGILTETVELRGLLAGVISGVVVNIIIWQASPWVFWMWWNLWGLITSVAVSWTVSKAVSGKNATSHEQLDGKPKPPDNSTSPKSPTVSLSLSGIPKKWKMVYGFLVFYFCALLIFLAVLTSKAN